MRGFKIYELRFTIFLISVLLITYHTLPITSYAQTASESAKVASKNANPLVDKINELKKEIASKAAQLKTEVNKRLENKAIFGIVQDKSDSKITLQTKKGNRTIIINEYTLYESKVSSKKRISLDNISQDDQIVCLGDVDDKDNLTAKKIVILPSKEKVAENKLIWGQVESNNGSVVKVKTRDGQVINLYTSQNTQFKLGNNEEALLQDAKVNKFVVALGRGKGNILNAEFVYVITKGGVLQTDKKTATASATH